MAKSRSRWRAGLCFSFAAVSRSGFGLTAAASLPPVGYVWRAALRFLLLSRDGCDIIAA